MMMWCFAGRQGDVVQPMRGADAETGRIEMSFRYGKRTARDGDHSAISFCTEESLTTFEHGWFENG